MTAKNKLPPIRFKGFHGEWKNNGFSVTFTNIPNNTLSRDELNYNFGLAKNIHYGDVLIKFGELLDIQKEEIPFISNSDYVNKLKSSKLQNGDIVIADAAEDEIVGKCTEITNIEKDTVLSGLHTIAVRPTQSFASKYLGYYMNSSSYHNQLLPLLQGTKVLSISNSVIKKSIISYPKDPLEQTKIGNYFQNLDKLIEQKEKKYQKLGQLKKAILEKMFPKEGATTPEIRFKGFSGEWEEKSLDEIGNATSGTSIESEFLDRGKYKVISIGSYSEHSTYTDQGIRANLSKKTQKRILNKNDLTMVLNDKTASGNILGRVLLIEDNDTFIYNQRTQRIELYQDEYVSPFIYQLLNAPLVRRKIINKSQGNTQIYVNWSGIKELCYLIPQKNEQTKIGNYFQKLDHLIDLQNQELQKLKNIKKASLAKMFV